MSLLWEWLNEFFILPVLMPEEPHIPKAFKTGFLFLNIMGKKNDYAEKLKSPKWQKKRLEIFKRDKWKCKKCGDKETTLCVHHLEYSDGEPWEIDNNYLVTLCEDCHEIIEANKEVSYDNIIVHKIGCWLSGAKIFIMQIGNQPVLRIYENKNSSSIGFNLNTDIILDFIRAFKQISK